MKVNFYENSYSDNTHKEVVEVLERLLEIGEVVYDKYGQTETVKSFEEVEPVNDRDRECYTFYKMIVEFKDLGDDEAEDDSTQYIAIKKEEA